MTYGPVSLTRLRDFRYLHSLNVALSRAMTTSNCIGRHSQDDGDRARCRTLRKSTPKELPSGPISTRKGEHGAACRRPVQPAIPRTCADPRPGLSVQHRYQGDCLPDRMCVRVVGTENIHTYTPLRHLTKVTCHSIYCSYSSPKPVVPHPWRSCFATWVGDHEPHCHSAHRCAVFMHRAAPRLSIPLLQIITLPSPLPNHSAVASRLKLRS
jgi:hypothetical protein